MADPLSQAISLLRPRAPFSKLVKASGAWRIRREEVEKAYYCLMLDGQACLEVDGKPPVDLRRGDFVLVPAAPGFSMSSIQPALPAGQKSSPRIRLDGTARVGPEEAPVNVQALVGYCSFGAPDAELLVSLLPDIAVVRGEARLGELARLVREEARAERPAKDVVLEHLLQVLLIEALRSATDAGDMPGLLRGLGDERLAGPLRAIHAKPARAWSVAELARTAGLSRSSFFTRFNRVVGMPPMEYLQRWRMTLARSMLNSKAHSISEIATKVGYGSTSAFSTAFSRSTGVSPARYSRKEDGERNPALVKM
ncbi:AraC family transcriptional regulator [Nitratireductor kimnyeongensis]|uniref:AraC family transcriptional regulator n=1 Tax=Nitratireductor kimnyeongensis TaxID=430679 RepID=A0ABW0TCG9_9HYPH|nr:AraC family transcriptional regulator [Nitratireductor kimnyeongensis]QZZ36879.1 AraC family transcriptional regulator [Nitratireductor kimnyeongensis]